MSYCGLNQPGSSKLDAVRPIHREGVSDSAPVIREPQSAQKPRLCRPPSTRSVKCVRSVPFVTLNAFDETSTTGTYAPPVTFWQVWQWQLNMRKGFFLDS